MSGETPSLERLQAQHQAHEIVCALRYQHIGDQLKAMNERLNAMSNRMWAAALGTLGVIAFAFGVTAFALFTPGEAVNEGRDATVALWGSIAVSMLVLSAYTAMSMMLFFFKLSPEVKEIALLVYGGWNSAAAAIIGFWVGSSIGSARKDTTISNLTTDKR